MNGANRRPFGFAIVALICILLIGAVSVSAQATPTPITIGQNQTGTLTDASGSILYTLEVNSPQSVTVVALAVTSGFAPTFRVLDPGGVVVFDSANDGTQAIVQGSPNLSSPGIYTIEVRSANNTTGQFLMGIQAGAPLAPPTPLTLGTPVNGAVDGQTTRQAYAFSGSTADKLLLTIASAGDDAAIMIALRDASTHELISLNSAGLLGLSYRLPAQARAYLLEITTGSSGTSQAFTVCLATESDSAPCPGTTTDVTAVQVTPTLIAAVPSLTPTFAPAAINPSGACEVTPSRNNSVNVRSGAGTGYPIVANLRASATALVVGRLPDYSWYQVNVSGVLGWVSSTVVIPGGNCASVAVVILPTSIPPTAAPPTAVMPPFGSVFTDTPTPSPTPVPATQLDPSASAIHGNLALNYVVDPDPYPIAMASPDGGSIDVSYLGACNGFTTSQAAMRIDYTGLVRHRIGANPPVLLRFYFVASDPTQDTALVVLDPRGNYNCNDNSFGFANPTIDFHDGLAASGRYLIWVCQKSPGENIGGTLYITSSESNAP